MTRLFRLFIIAACIGVFSPTLAAAQTGIIVGRVTQTGGDSARPISGVTVMIVGTKIGTRTNNEGRYKITGAPTGPRQVRALRIGYESQTQSVTVNAADSVTSDFTLRQVATSLEAMVTNVTGETQRKRETGNAVTTLAPDSVQKSAIASLSDLLSSRIAGVTVDQASGTTGGGSRIRIRGSNSISLQNNPLIIVDGVRVNSNDASGTVDVGGQHASRLDDFNPEDIENIEILRGPAAAALYGTAAANGVIQITTKRGRAGQARWDSHAEYGSVRNVADFPANFALPGVDPDGNSISRCTLYFQALGACTPKPDSLISFNPLKQYSPFVNGWRQDYGLSVAGGSDVATYYIGGNYNKEQGVYTNNDARRVNLRSNVSAHITPKLDATLTAGYLQSRVGLPSNDNNTNGLLGNGYLGSPYTANTDLHGYLQISPDISNAIITRQDVDRILGTLNVTWRPLPWLSGTAVTGVDYMDRYDQFFLPPGLFDPADQRGSGQRSSNPYSLWTYTANLSVSAVRDLTARLQSTTTLGAQYNKDLVRGTEAFGQGIASGTGSLGGATSGFAATESHSDVITVGRYIQQQIAWRDRMFLAAAIRSDDNSAFGQDFKLINYPSVSLSWVIGEEAFFPKSNFLGTMRLRTLYGQSGQRPNFRDAITYFTSVSFRQNGTEGGGAVLGGVGNPDLRPERSAEYEAGFEAGFFRDRVSTEFTYYNKTTRDALISRPLPPSTGGDSRFENLGKVTNKGFEWSLSSMLIDRHNLQFDLAITGSSNSNRLIALGAGVDTIQFGLSGGALPVQRFAEGYPLGGYWQFPFTYSDANGDGIVGLDEVELSDQVKYFGSPMPKVEISYNPSVTLFTWLRVSALFDHRSGAKLYNATESLRCLLQRCQEIFDPKTPLADQATAVASLLGSDAGYFEDASFTKLRELSVTASLPVKWARLAHARAASFTVSGRNLHTWTNYKGMDPEVNFDGQENFSTADFFTQPPVRYWTTRLSFTF